MLYNEEIVPLKKESESDDEIRFSFGEKDELILNRNPLGPIFQRNGNENDLCISINGFNKILYNLIIDEKRVIMKLHNG